MEIIIVDKTGMHKNWSINIKSANIDLKQQTDFVPISIQIKTNIIRDQIHNNSHDINNTKTIKFPFKPTNRPSPTISVLFVADNPSSDKPRVFSGHYVIS